MLTYRLHDHAGDDLGLLEHPAPNVEPELAALLEVVVATEPQGQA